MIDRTRDHTRVAQMVSHGILTPEEARNHPDAHVLVQALGGSAGIQKSFKPEVWTDALELRAGDVVLLCSDGLYDFIEDHELYPLMEGHDYQDAVSRLIRLANERGGADNITAILLVVGQPEVPRTTTPKEERRETQPDIPLPVPTPVVQAPPVAPSPVVSARAESPKRGVPLWLLLATGVLALGVGIALGVMGAGESP